MSSGAPRVGGITDTSSGGLERAAQDGRLQVSIGRAGRVVLVGDVDLVTAPLLDAALRDVDDAAGIVLDLRGVTYLDSTAVTVLFAHARRPMRILAQQDSAVADVLRVCALAQLARVELSPTTS